MRRWARLLLLTLLTVSVLTVSGCDGDDPDEADEEPTEDVEPDDSEDDDEGEVRIPDGFDRTVTLFVDGWSQRIADSETVTWAVPGFADDERFEAELHPLGRDDVEELLNTNPDVATRIAHRMFDAVFCTSWDDCTLQRGDGGAWDPEAFVDPALEPHTGEVHDHFDVTAGIWVADVHVPRGAPHVEVAVGDDDPARLQLVERDEDDVPDYVNPQHPINDLAAYGYGRGEYVIGSAFGVTSRYDPQWVIEDDGMAYFWDEVVRDVADDVTVGDLPGHEWTLDGLASSPTAPAPWDDHHLMGVSAAGLGCAGGLLCVPDDVDSLEVDVVERDATARVCDEESGAVLAATAAVTEVTHHEAIALPVNHGAADGITHLDPGETYYQRLIVYYGGDPLSVQVTTGSYTDDPTQAQWNGFDDVPGLEEC